MIEMIIKINYGSLLADLYWIWCCETGKRDFLSSYSGEMADLICEDFSECRLCPEW